MYSQLSLLLAFSTLGQSAAAAATRLSRCQENVAVHVSATADTLSIPDALDISALVPLDPSYLQTLALHATTKNVSGNYTIRGRYCEPLLFHPRRHNTLQLLVHGITFTRDYWAGPEPPNRPFRHNNEYSWIDYASKEGYPTLSIDRLCNGESSKPDGARTCQISMNTATIHSVIQAARSGHFGGRPFDKIVYVGHSQGSVIGNRLAQQFPDDVDTYIQTGFSPVLNKSGVGTLTAGAFKPALIRDSAEFGGDVDLAYLTASNRSGVEGLFFAGDYERAVANREWYHRGTVPLGEFLTSFEGQAPAPRFTGSLLAMNGQRDQIFCTRLPSDPVVGYRGDCGFGESSYTAMVRTLYPGAGHFRYENVPNTGHNLNLHDTAQESFRIAHEFLSGKGY